jgi:CBS domain containing-hemolysin-like protein
MTPFDALDVALVIAAAVLVPLAGVLAAADAAITTVSPARVEELQREGRRGAGSLADIVRDRPRYTNLLLLLRVGCELTATVIVAAVSFSTWGFTVLAGLLVVLVMVVVTYVVIGVLPRTLGRQHSYPVGLALAGSVRGVTRVLSPVAGLLIRFGNLITPGRGFREGPFSSDVELRELVEIAGRRGVVEETEREMLQSVFDLGDTIAREVMVPRTDVVWIEADKSLRQTLHLTTRSGFSRIPVIGEDIDDVIGVAYVKDVIANGLAMDAGRSGATTVAEVMRPPVFVPESKRVDELLREMQRNRNHFAVVIDEYGGTAGIVTIEDVLEEIVGEITDEYDHDQPAPVEHLADEVVRVSARLPVDDLGELFSVELPDEEVETVGGLLAQLLGRVPLPGASATVAGLRLEGEEGRDRRGRPRVRTLLVRRLTEQEQAELEALAEQDALREQQERREEQEHREEQAAEQLRRRDAADTVDAADGDTDPDTDIPRRDGARREPAGPDHRPTDGLTDRGTAGSTPERDPAVERR